MPEQDEQIGELRDKASEVQNARDTVNSLSEELTRNTQLLSEECALPVTEEIEGIVAEVMRQVQGVSETLGTMASELRAKVEQAEQEERARREQVESDGQRNPVD
jgi:uncharacterized protein YukE